MIYKVIRVLSLFFMGLLIFRQVFVYKSVDLIDLCLIVYLLFLTYFSISKIDS